MTDAADSREKTESPEAARRADEAAAARARARERAGDEALPRKSGPPRAGSGG